MELICQPLLLWWLNKRHSDKNKQQLPRADSHQTHTHTHMFLCSYSATFIGLKCHSDAVRWSSAMAASIHDDRRTLEVKSGGRVTCDLPLWSQPLDIQPTKQIRGNSATSTHLTAESLFAHFTQVLTFHGAVIRPPVGAWRPTPCLTVWSVFLFIHHCGGWPVATLHWFPKWTVILLWCCRNRKTQREQNCWDSPPEICVRASADWLLRPQPFQIMLSAQMMNAGPRRIRKRKMNDQFHFQQSHL